MAKRRDPSLFTLRDISYFTSLNGTTVKINNEWMPARPLGSVGGFLPRLRLAWAVFRGKYDAVKWPGDQ